MAEAISPTNTFLSRLVMFRGLRPNQLEQLAQYFETVDLEAGEELFKQGDQPDYFYIIQTGQLQVSHQSASRARDLATLVPGDSVGEEALLYGGSRSVTLTALKKSRLLRLNQRQFVRLLDLFPSVRHYLQATVESRRLSRTKGLGWIAPGETIYLMARKHVAALIVSLIGPVVVGWVAILVLFFSLGVVMPGFRLVLYWSGIVLLVVAVLWTIWNWIDWGNDYYIVTNQRVIWLEKVVGLYDSRQEAPLGTILTVGINRDYWGRLLGYGDVSVRTFTGEIRMTRVGLPAELAALIEEQVGRNKQIVQQVETEKLERAIRQRLGLPVAEAEGDKSGPKPGQIERKRPFFHRLTDLFLIQFERAGVVTFRKHWILLLRRVWLPTLILTGLIAVIAARFMDVFTFFSTNFVLLIAVTTIPVILAWWAYDYVDWANDLYQVTPELIVDVYRKPFGSEDKKTAPLENILSLEHERLGIIGLIFNYGNVVAMVGGVRFTFDGVYNPAGVQQEIFMRLSARKRAIKEQEAQRERDRIADWMAAYHRQAENIRRFQSPPGSET